MAGTRASGTRAAINGPSLVAGVPVIASRVPAQAAASTRDRGRAYLSGLTTVTTMVTNTLFGVKAPGQGVVDRRTLLRIHLSVSPAAPPKVVGQTLIATDVPEQASSSAFVRGPTGVGQFTAQAGSVIAAVPPAVPGPGHFIGEGLFE